MYGKPQLKGAKQMARWRSRKKYGGSIPALWKKSVHFVEKFEKSEDLFEKPKTQTLG